MLGPTKHLPRENSRKQKRRGKCGNDRRHAGHFRSTGRAKEKSEASRAVLRCDALQRSPEENASFGPQGGANPCSHQTFRLRPSSAFAQADRMQKGKFTHFESRSRRRRKRTRLPGLRTTVFRGCPTGCVCHIVPGHRQIGREAEGRAARNRAARVIRSKRPAANGQRSAIHDAN